MSNIDQENQEASNEELRSTAIDNAMKSEMAKIMGATIETPSDKPDIQEVKEPATEESKDDKPAVLTMEEQIQEVIRENQKLKKSIDSTNGRYGSELQQLKAKLNEFQQLNTQASGLSGTSGIDGRLANLTIDHPAFESLKEDYPELAAGLVTAFKKALSDNNTNQQPKHDQVVNQQQEQRQADPIVTQEYHTTKRLALDALQRQHPDFGNIAGFSMSQIAKGVSKIEWKDKEFGAWVESMPDDVRDTIINGGTEEDPAPQTILNVLDILTKYKETRPETPTENQTTGDIGNKKTTVTQQIKPDLSKSLLPSGRNHSGKVTLTRDEVIEAAKRAEMAKHMIGR